MYGVPNYTQKYTEDLAKKAHFSRPCFLATISHSSFAWIRYLDSTTENPTKEAVFPATETDSCTIISQSSAVSHRSILPPAQNRNGLPQGLCLGGKALQLIRAHNLPTILEAPAL